MNKLLSLLLLLALLAAPATAQEPQALPSPTATAEHRALRDSILSLVTGASEAAAGDLIIDIQRLGARPDGTTDCRPAFQRALSRAARQKGRTTVIRVRAGTYYICGPLTLVSNLRLQLDSGATLRFDPSPDRYPTVETSWEGTRLLNYSPMIYGRNLTNVAITGRGTIDGNAMTTFATWKPQQRPDRDLSRRMNHEQQPVQSRRFGPGHYLRPPLVQLYGCREVTLEGVMITNSPFWCIHLLDCENVVCRALRYDAKLINNDGIDPESSRNILIEDVTFDNGDDNIAIKAGRDNDGWAAPPCENIVIRRCHFKGLHAVVIGSEMSGGVSNVVVEDCDYAGYCKRGIYVKTNRDRGGYVRRLYVANCRFGDVEDLFYVTSMYAGEGADSPYPSTIAGIHVDGLTARHVSQAAVTVQGTPERPVTDVTLRAIDCQSATIGLSLDCCHPVTMADCHIGGRSTVPSLDTKDDHLFDR